MHIMPLNVYFEIHYAVCLNKEYSIELEATHILIIF